MQAQTYACFQMLTSNGRNGDAQGCVVETEVEVEAEVGVGVACLGGTSSVDERLQSNGRGGAPLNTCGSSMADAERDDAAGNTEEGDNDSAATAASGVAATAIEDPPAAVAAASDRDDDDDEEEEDDDDCARCARCACRLSDHATFATVTWYTNVSRGVYSRAARTPSETH